MSFRFRVVNGDTETFTQWYDEPQPSPAAQVATKIRAASPEAVIYVQRKAGEARDLNKPDDVNGR